MTTGTVERTLTGTCKHLRRDLASGHLHADGVLLCDECERIFKLTYLGEVSIPMVLIHGRWVSLKALARAKRAAGGTV
jgi:hypothetical protein